MAVRLVLCGGIASGKSTVSKILAGLGAVVFSADEHARRVLAPGTAATATVIARWPQVADAGVIDRAKVGHLVFSDPDRLATLEAITHPPTRQSLLEAVAEVPEADVVVEMPILRDWFDGWTRVVVDAPEEIRLARAMARADEMTESDIGGVMARQPTREEWLLAADLVIDNHLDLAALESECRAVWEHVTNA